MKTSWNICLFLGIRRVWSAPTSKCTVPFVRVHKSSAQQLLLFVTDHHDGLSLCLQHEHKSSLRFTVATGGFGLQLAGLTLCERRRRENMSPSGWPFPGIHGDSSNWCLFFYWYKLRQNLPLCTACCHFIKKKHQRDILKHLVLSWNIILQVLIWVMSLR